MTLVEITLPLLFSVILIVLRQKVSFTNYPNGTHYDSFSLERPPTTLTSNLQFAYVPANSSVVRQVAEDVQLSLKHGFISAGEADVLHGLCIGHAIRPYSAFWLTSTRTFCFFVFFANGDFQFSNNTTEFPVAEKWADCYSIFLEKRKGKVLIFLILQFSPEWIMWRSKLFGWNKLCRMPMDNIFTAFILRGGAKLQAQLVVYTVCGIHIQFLVRCSALFHWACAVTSIGICLPMKSRCYLLLQNKQKWGNEGMCLSHDR